MKFLRSQNGFLLIELMIVITIIGILSTVVILNFRSGGTRSALRQVTQQVVSDIRRAQSLAVSSTRAQSKTTCGFGIYYVDPGVYGIYNGPDSQVVDCSAENKNYEVGRDDVFVGISVLDNNIEFISPFPDIFFEPPDPKTYINNDSSVSASPGQIVLRIVGGTCPQDCSTITITTAGLVEVQ